LNPEILIIQSHPGNLPKLELQLHKKKFNNPRSSYLQPSLQGETNHAEKVNTKRNKFSKNLVFSKKNK
jgi:hypothetical protein